MTTDTNAASRNEAATAPVPFPVKTYVIVGVVAAAVSAATAAYIFWARSRHLAPHAETVQDLLDRCHNQVRDIERRLGELHPQQPPPNRVGQA